MVEAEGEVEDLRRPAVGGGGRDQHRRERRVAGGVNRERLEALATRWSDWAQGSVVQSWALPG